MRPASTSRLGPTGRAVALIGLIALAHWGNADAVGADALEPSAQRDRSSPAAAADVGSEAPGSLRPWESLFRGDYEDPALPKAFLADLGAHPGIRRTVLLETTLSWGCACPTWAFPFHDDMDALQHPMLLPAPGLKSDPTGLAVPGTIYRITGRFTGAEITGLEWARQRGEPPPSFPGATPGDPQVLEYWMAPGPVLVVEDWCFEPDGDPQDAQWLRARGAVQCRD